MMRKSVRKTFLFVRSVMALTLAVSMSLPQAECPSVSAETDGQTLEEEVRARSINLNINGCIAGLHDPVVPESPEQEWSAGRGSRIWYGSYDANGLFKVLDCDAEDFTQDGSRTIFLEAGNYFLTDMAFDMEADHGQNVQNEWKNSDIYRYLNAEAGYGYLMG